MQPDACRRQPVLSLGRHDAVNLALDDSRSFQLAQNLYEHFLRDIGDLMLHFIEAANTAGKAKEDDWSPFVADEFKDAPSWITLVENNGWRGGAHLVT